MCSEFKVLLDEVTAGQPGGEFAMFSSFKFPTLRLRSPRAGAGAAGPGEETARANTNNNPVRSKPPKTPQTPVLGANRVKRHQRRKIFTVFKINMYFRLVQRAFNFI